MTIYQQMSRSDTLTRPFRKMSLANMVAVSALVGIRADPSPESLLELIGSYGRTLNTLLTSATYIPPRLRQLLSNSHYTTGQ